jgi:hypothetical protein
VTFIALPTVDNQVQNLPIAACCVKRRDDVNDVVLGAHHHENTAAAFIQKTDRVSAAPDVKHVGEQLQRFIDLLFGQCARTAIGRDLVEGTLENCVPGEEKPCMCVGVGVGGRGGGVSALAFSDEYMIVCVPVYARGRR